MGLILNYGLVEYEGAINSYKGVIEGLGMVRCVVKENIVVMIEGVGVVGLVMDLVRKINEVNGVFSVV